MSPTSIALIIVAAALLIVPILIYNGLVSKRNQARNAYSSIDVNLRKRHELIPSLVETVKGYAAHEEALFKSLAESRRRLASGELDPATRLREEAQVGPAMRQLIAVADSYPELLSSVHFLNLQRNLTEIEEQISAARRAYNAAVFEINTAVESSPSNLLAQAFGFHSESFFEGDDAARTAPTIPL